jgi:hypothetical protein
MLTDARQHILQITPLGHVIMHVVGGHQGNADLPGEPCQRGQPVVIRAVVRKFRGQ